MLLIVAALDQPALERLQQRAWELGLAALVEVHDARNCRGPSTAVRASSA